MSSAALTLKSDRTFTVHVPWTLRKRGGRKLVLAPDGAPLTMSPPRIDSAVTKAIARAHRWKRMLETGPYTSLRELAAAEKINEAYLGRVLRLTLLAPDIVEGILAGRVEVELAVLLEPMTPVWKEQKGLIMRLDPNLA